MSELSAYIRGRHVGIMFLFWSRLHLHLLLQACVLHRRGLPFVVGMCMVRCMFRQGFAAREGMIVSTHGA